MKNTLLKTAFGVLGLSLFATQASAATGCLAKKQEIEQQIQWAQQQGNTHRVAGLEQALSEVNDHCTESGLEKQRQEKVNEKTLKVREREEDLAEAQTKGDQQKISKQQRKLEEAREELREAQAQLTK
ncbi:DUF1090 domain-containing protein [Pantoea sp. BAV 3049]|uniref:DUF1090 domain-containing protein n=1 Tax=Pantoea sp. BAV 3049 TaxID=2654188 RepID=UPI00131A9C16|nr:DUF1090 domain-containing protein [Pantoea sp. BAV 3049]